MECKYYGSDDDRIGCLVQSADLSSKTIGTNFSFSGTQEQKQITLIKFSFIGRVAHLPRNLFEEFPKLNDLQIWNSDIQILRNNFFKPEFSKLQKLELNSDEIKIIDETAFKYLTNLKNIHLDRNKIKSLPAKVFQNNHKLKWIFIEYNKIKQIHPETFKNLNQLKEIYLWQNVCTNETFGCDTVGCQKSQLTEVDRLLQPCYENHAKSLELLNEGEKNYKANIFYRDRIVHFF